MTTPSAPYTVYLCTVRPPESPLHQLNALGAGEHSAIAVSPKTPLILVAGLLSSHPPSLQKNTVAGDERRSKENKHFGASLLLDRLGKPYKLHPLHWSVSPRIAQLPSVHLNNLYIIKNKYFIVYSLVVHLPRRSSKLFYIAFLFLLVFSLLILGMRKWR